MKEILVVIEHRQGQIRDISYEMLWKANQLAEGLSGNVTAVIMGENLDELTSALSDRADKVVALDHESLKHFDSRMQKEILAGLIKESTPAITLIANSAWGMELAPCLAVKTGFPLATDCVDITLQDGNPLARRQIYGGKIFTDVSLKESEGYIFTVRGGVFPPDRAGERQAQIAKKDPGEIKPGKEFLEFEETGAGEVDITQAEVLVSVGRGVGEEENIPQVRELAEALSGVLSCSRPIVDKNWLPKYLQVGTSGKSVSPKVYIAVGISGAFQHMAGIGGADTIIAINKDPKAPIFRGAHYGIVEDWQKIVPVLKERILELKKG